MLAPVTAIKFRKVIFEIFFRFRVVLILSLFSLADAVLLEPYLTPTIGYNHKLPITTPTTTLKLAKGSLHN